MTNVTRLPEPGVILDLDTEERDPKDVKDPFVFVLGGRRIQMKDPSEIDWRDLAAVSIPGDLLRVAMTNEDVDHMRKQSIPAWKFNKLMAGYYAHYDLEDKIQQAKRQAAFGV